MIEQDSEINSELINMAYPFLRSIKQYHQHEVIGIDNVPTEGPAIVAVNHSLATYDIALLFLEIYDRLGRLTRPLADHLFFKFPYAGEFIQEFGAVEGKQENASRLLKQGEILGVAPGGMREALRPSTERYQILWDKRKGFARLSLESGAPIIIAVCPKADDLYDVYQNPITAWAYKKFRIPLFLAKGMAFTPIPRKIKLIHFLSEAIYPPKPKSDPEAFKRQLTRYHKKLVKRSQDLIGEAIAYRG